MLNYSAKAERGKFFIVHHDFINFSLRIISGNSVKLYLALRKHADHRGACFPSYQTLMNVTGITTRNTLRRCIKELTECGLLKATRANNRSGYWYELQSSDPMAFLKDEPLSFSGSDTAGEPETCVEPNVLSGRSPTGEPPCVEASISEPPRGVITNPKPVSKIAPQLNAKKLDPEELNAREDGRSYRERPHREDDRDPQASNELSPIATSARSKVIRNQSQCPHTDVGHANDFTYCRDCFKELTEAKGSSAR